MVIRSVALTHVRNHSHMELGCARHVTVLTGPNGSGKTSVLEGISLCAIAKSFVPVPDQALIMRGQEECVSTVHAVRDRDVPYRVTIQLKHGVRKRIATDAASNCTPRDIIGELPMVALCPDHKAITFGGPLERRSFLDGVMAQCSRRYTTLLYEHRRLLKQRNALLQASASSAELEPWTNAFINVNAEIVARRAAFLKELTPIVHKMYGAVCGLAEEISIEYAPDVMAHAGVHDVDLFSAVEVERAYQVVALNALHKEQARQTTLFGAQKDEVVFTINGGLVREMASQGQHKTLLVALKMAECTILNQRRNERPVVLLDDVFSELDADRCRRVLHLVVGMGMQCFVTTTNGPEVMELMEDLGKGLDTVVETVLHPMHRAEAA